MQRAWHRLRHSHNNLYFRVIFTDASRMAQYRVVKAGFCRASAGIFGKR